MTSMKQLFRQLLLLTSAIALVVAFATSVSAAEKKAKRAKVSKITFETCCDQSNNDTNKCLKMKKVKAKKSKVGKKWVAKACPQPEPTIEANEDSSMDDSGESDDGF